MALINAAPNCHPLIDCHIIIATYMRGTPPALDLWSGVSCTALTASPMAEVVSSWQMIDGGARADASVAPVLDASELAEGSGLAYYSPSNLPSMHGPPSECPTTPSRQMTSASLISTMAAELAGADKDDKTDKDDKLALRHVETFNILCAGESGLGKSTFLRDIFAHLDPSKLHDLKRRVAEALTAVRNLEDEVERNEKESRLSDDQRALELLSSREDLKRRAAEARVHLEKEQQCLHEHRQTIIQIRGEIEGLQARLVELRAARDTEDDDAEAQRIARDVIELSSELGQREAALRAELLRSSLDERRGERQPQQTTAVSARLIKNMPLYDGADVGLDVTLIDTPGTGDLLVRVPPPNRPASERLERMRMRMSLRHSIAHRTSRRQQAGCRYCTLTTVHPDRGEINPHRRASAGRHPEPFERRSRRG